ncbi:MAG: archease [Candidatus Altiarchaeales archaeon ex4484_2]|nr:MAG: archease [Candidatus Altiarchaeales archaeon ex4484_2]
MKEFEFLEHTADLKFRSYGNSLSECFINCARAFTHSIADLGSIKKEKSRELKIRENELDLLLHDFLSELLFLFETENLLFSEYDIEVEESGGYVMRASARGEEYTPGRHLLKTEIKAVTLHDLYVKKMEGKWVAQVLCDI